MFLYYFSVSKKFNIKKRRKKNVYKKGAIAWVCAVMERQIPSAHPQLKICLLSLKNEKI